MSVFARQVADFITRDDRSCLRPLPKGYTQFKEFGRAGAIRPQTLASPKTPQPLCVLVSEGLHGL
jgi:hypothetical protein